MKIKSLHIKNFKSIVDLTINEPNPFTVFVGPNGGGKSNIFEALEFMTYGMSGLDFFGLFNEDWLNFKLGSKTEHNISIFDGNYKIGHIVTTLFGGLMKLPHAFDFHNKPIKDIDKKDIYQFIQKSSRVFVGNNKIQKINFKDDTKLTLSCDNLEKVLKRLLEN